jgi:hypothetical protein
MGIKLLLKLYALLTATTVAGLVTTLGGTRLPMHNPFAPYMGITPGHSTEALSDYGCELLTYTNSDGEVGDCHFDPGDGVFRQIRISEANRIITRLTFVIIPNQITLGDTILCWGVPKKITAPFPTPRNDFNVYWGSGEILGLVSPLVNLERPDYALPITFLSITPQSTTFDEDRLLCR